MRVQSIRLKRFKRFSDLTIENIPESAKLVVIAGPNGSGKSSLFEAFLSVRRHQGGFGYNWDANYYIKQPELGESNFNESIDIKFHGDQPNSREKWRKSIYVRSAYRNDPDFQLQSLNRLGSLLDEHRVERLIHNDASVANNYGRLTAQGLAPVVA